MKKLPKMESQRRLNILLDLASVTNRVMATVMTTGPPAMATVMTMEQPLMDIITRKNMDTVMIMDFLVMHIIIIIFQFTYNYNPV